MSSNVPNLPPLSDLRFVPYVQEAKNPALYVEFYRIVKTLNGIEKDSPEMQNIKQMIAMLTNHVIKEEKKNKNRLKSDADKYDRCKKELNKVKRDNQLLSASKKERDEECDEFRQQLTNCQQQNSDMCRELAAANERETSLEIRAMYYEQIYNSCDAQNDSLKADLTAANKEVTELRKKVAESERIHEETLKQLHTAAENEKKWKYNFDLAVVNGEEEKKKLRQTIQAQRGIFNEEDVQVAKLSKKLMNKIINKQIEAEKLVKAAEHSSTTCRNTSEEQSVQESLDMGPLAQKRIRLALSTNFTTPTTTLASDNGQQENQEPLDLEPPEKRIRLALSTTCASSCLTQATNSVASDPHHSAASIERSVPEQNDGEEED